MKLQTAKSQISKAANKGVKCFECLTKLDNEDERTELREWLEERELALWTKETLFTRWLDRFLSEKGIDPERVFEVDGAQYGTNFIPVGVVVQHIKITSPAEQAKIKNVLVAIDFKNGDVYHFLNHLAKSLAK